MRKGSPLYKRILDLHLYAALLTGIVMVVLAVSGCLLIFERKIDKWTNPSVSYVTPQGEQLPFTKILVQLNTAFPQRRVKQIDQDEPNNSIVATLNDKTQVYVNGYTGQILGTRTSLLPSDYVRLVHRVLLVGKVGGWIVATTTFLLLFQSLSGMYLWWPLKRITVKRKTSWIRINFDLHHALGFYTFAFVSLICITGIARYYEKRLEPLVNRVTNTEAIETDLPSRNIPTQTNAASKITIDDAVAIAKAQLPGSSLVRIIPPENKNSSFVVRMRFPGDEQPSARSWVVVDQYSGEVLSRLDMRSEPVGGQFGAVNRSVHTGDIYGWPTRLLIGLSSLAVVLQTITGFIMWWKRKKYSMWLKRKLKLVKEEAPVRARAAA
jgi:uncharacterized iron-regulated membrane protein